MGIRISSLEFFFEFFFFPLIHANWMEVYGVFFIFVFFFSCIRNHNYKYLIKLTTEANNTIHPHEDGEKQDRYKLTIREPNKKTVTIVRFRHFFNNFLYVWTECTRYISQWMFLNRKKIQKGCEIVKRSKWNVNENKMEYLLLSMCSHSMEIIEGKFTHLWKLLWTLDNKMYMNIFRISKLRHNSICICNTICLQDNILLQNSMRMRLEDKQQ